jgi:large subunit ribosomal protein L9
MKIILQESYMNLGEAGEIVNVKPGYARNFLIPNKLAVTATNANLKLFQDKAKELELKRTSERDKSQKLVDGLKGISVTLTKKVGEDGKLYGSVSSKEIEDALAGQNFVVDRRMIVLGQQIKTSGEFSILIKLVGGLRTNITLNVVPEASKKN